MSPRSIGGGNTQLLSVFVDDVDAHCTRAAPRRRDLPRAGDERLRLEYAMDRTYGALDPDGHLWFFMQRLRDPPPVSPA